MNEKGFYLYNNKYYYCSNTNTLINSSFKKIYDQDSAKRKVEIAEIKVDENRVKSSIVNLIQIVFEVTQKCNLKCTYCTYESGEYIYNRAPNSSKSLEFNTAKRSLEQVWKVIKNRSKKEFTIGFYGGESLLNFSVIKRIVEYTKKTFLGWKLIFAITTNGTLFNNDIINFFIENNFVVLVSLDGPKENNDEKRVFSDGSGAFKKITGGLRKLKSVNKKYYEENVSLSVVFSKDLSFHKLIDFFSENALVKKNNVNLGFVNESDSTYYKNNPFNHSEFSRDFGKAFDSIKIKMSRNKALSPFEIGASIEHKIVSESLGKKRFSCLMGTCIYNSRLYVDVEGGFHICEKINDKFQFGNSVEGFDYAKMTKITGDYLKLLEACDKCEIQLLCQRCYINFAKNGVFEIGPDFCADSKHVTKKILEDLIQIEEGRTDG